MKLLAVVLIMLTAPPAALANGAPCGEPPKLENAEAARVIDQTVSADLGTAPVEAPFINRARESIADLIEQYGLSRAQVVELYVFHICEALYARGTGPGELSKSLSRMKQALADPAPQPEAESAAPEGASSGEAAKEDASAAPAEPRAENTETLTQQSAQKQSAVSPGQGNSAMIGNAPNAANRLNQRALSGNLQRKSYSITGQASKQKRAYRPAPKPSQRMITQFGAGGGGGGTAIGAGRGQSNNAGSANVPNARISRKPATAPRIAQPAAPSASSAPVPSADDAPEPQEAPQPMAAMRAPATVTATEERDEPAPVTQAPSQDDGVSTTAAPEAAAQLSENAVEMPVEDAPETAAVQPGAAEETTEVQETAQAESTVQTEETAQASDAARAEAPSGAEVTASSAANGNTETAGERANAATAATTASRSAQASNGACPERGVLGPECFDVDAALERLRDRPVEYNHPEQMIKDQATEITLVLRTDFTEEGLPEEASTAFEGLQGEVRQQRAKISTIMSARLRGRDFEVDPGGMQERTVTWRRPVEWSWYVTPKSGGEAKRLELELYAHIVNPQGETQPPVLIKTLDATIDVDVRTLDWLVEQARTFEPIYAIAAAIIGLLTALMTLWLRRKPAYTHGDGGGPPSGLTASQAPPDRRISDMSASEAAAAAARKGQDDGNDNGPPGDGRA